MLPPALRRAAPPATVLVVLALFAPFSGAQPDPSEQSYDVNIEVHGGEPAIVWAHPELACRIDESRTSASDTAFTSGFDTDVHVSCVHIEAPRVCYGVQVQGNVNTWLAAYATVSVTGRCTPSPVASCAASSFFGVPGSCTAFGAGAGTTPTSCTVKVSGKILNPPGGGYGGGGNCQFFFS